MNRSLAISAITASFLGAVPLASAQMKGMDMKDMDMKGMKSEKKAGAVHKGTGVVTKVEKDKVTIKHEPIASINWPAMTMAFDLKDKALLDKVAKDKKVQFEFVQEGKKNVITSIK
jgi:Cu(I)/Ag(I) efflux system periplasmic protein CusF